MDIERGRDLHRDFNILYSRSRYSVLRESRSRWAFDRRRRATHFATTTRSWVPSESCTLAWRGLRFWYILGFAKPRQIQSSRNLRWYLQQVYVNKVLTPDDTIPVNKQSGSTISIKKRGGWSTSWDLARDMAGWQVDWSWTCSAIEGVCD